MSFAFMPFYTGDYRRDTQHLSMMEHGAYLLLLAHCWDQKGPVPLDERRIFGICTARSNEEMGAVRHVLTEFFVRMDDGWYNRRIMREIEKSDAISHKRSEIGKLGAKASNSLKRKDIPPIAKQLLSNWSASAEQMPHTPTPTPTTTTTPNPNPKENPEVELPDPVGLSSNDSQKIEPFALEPAIAIATKTLACPVEKIVALWRECLPNLPQPLTITKERRQKIKLRWQWIEAESEAEGLAWLREFFAQNVGRSKFLTGRAPPNGNRAPFKASLDFVFRSEQQFAEISEGKYT